jgi:hypothetical protein
MSDVSSGARAPDPAYRADVPTGLTDPGYPADPTYPATEAYPVAETYPATASTPVTPSTSGGEESKARQVAGQTKEAAGQAAAEVKDTAKEQAQRVGAEARTQVRNVAGDVRNKVSEQARTQNDKLVGSIREMADNLEQMRGDRQDSPAATVVSRVAEGGRQMADYLDRNGPEGVLREVQDFARRRPGAFLATALAAGFVVGRLGKGVAKADPYAGSNKPASDSFVSRPDTAYSTGAGYSTGYTNPDPALSGAGYTNPDPALSGAGYTGADPAPSGGGYTDPDPAPSGGYATSTEYASTGTGTPVVVEEDYVLENPPSTRDYPGGAR